MGAARILIVEDDAILAAHKEDTLNRMGYQVIGITATGEQAIDNGIVSAAGCSINGYSSARRDDRHPGG